MGDAFEVFRAHVTHSQRGVQRANEEVAEERQEAFMPARAPLRRLQVVELAVDAPAREQLLVAARLDDATLVEDDDLVGVRMVEADAR